MAGTSPAMTEYYSLMRSKKSKRLPPIHPGEVLREEFLVPMKLSPYALAQACGVPRTRIERLAREESPVTADTALRLAGRGRRVVAPDQTARAGGGVKP
jgi:addiction module HigA family antidote